MNSATQISIEAPDTMVFKPEGGFAQSTKYCINMDVDAMQDYASPTPLKNLVVGGCEFTFTTADTLAPGLLSLSGRSETERSNSLG